MKKLIVILVAMVSFTLFSCGEDSSNEDSTKNEMKKVETSKTEHAKKEKKYVFVKDVYEKDLGLKATKNKYSQKDWDQIYKVCKAFPEFKKSTDVNKATFDEWNTFFVAQGYANMEEGNDDVLKFKELYKVALSLPVEIGSLNGIKKLYGEEKYKKSCAATGDEYNELNLSFEDLKNIEKYTKCIGEMKLIAMSLNFSQSLNK